VIGVEGYPNACTNTAKNSEPHAVGSDGSAKYPTPKETAWPINLPPATATQNIGCKVDMQ
jgi:hypothetical protein